MSVVYMPHLTRNSTYHKENGSLQTLDLSGKGLVRCHHMAEVLSCHPSLSDLILGGNKFSSPVAIKELCSAVRALLHPCVKFVSLLDTSTIREGS